MNQETAEKPTLQQIRLQIKAPNGQTITRQVLAERAGLPYNEVYVFDTGGHLAKKKF